MKAFLVACGLVVSALACHAAGDVSSSQPSVAERLESARKAMDKKDWRDAAGSLEKLLKDEPRNADVFNLLGFYNRKKPDADLPRAFEYYNAALKINPKHKGAHEYIGEAYLMDKKPQEAEKHLAQLESICGNKTCEEYQDLSKAIAQYKAAGK